jgi:hypothetical protein
MPGLLRGVARTAVIAGTATAVSNRVSRRQAGRWAEQEQAQAYQQQAYRQQAYPPAGYASPDDDASVRIAQLKELAALRDQGVLSQAEFEAQKSRLLAT